MGRAPRIGRRERAARGPHPRRRGPVHPLGGRGPRRPGIDPGELVGESVDDLFGDDPRLSALYDRAYDGEPAHAVVERDGVAFENWTRPIFDDDGEVARVIGVALDVTERAQYEGALAALHRSSRDLLDAKTGNDIASKVVEASTEVLDLTGVVVYLFDEDENVLRPAAYSPDVPATVGEPPTYGPASSITWNAFVTGETASFDDVRESEHVANPDTAVRSGLYIPLGDHGVLAVISPEHDVLTDETVELIDLFAATAETALDRVARERAVRNHRWELREQAARLEQLNEINEQLRRVERVLVFETTRDDIERAVCEQLTASDRFAFAWIGEVEDGEVEDGDLSPRAWAGTERGYFDAVSDPDEPAARTARTGDVTAVENVADGLRREPWRSEALSRGYQSVVAVPLVYDDLDYGVLTVYATRADAFDAMFRTVFAELGDTIAHAVDSAETKHGLLTDGVVELDLRVPEAADPLAHVARETGGRTTFEGVAPHPDGTRVFFSATGTSAAEIVDAAEESVAVRSIRVVSDRDDGGLFELTADGELLATTLSDHGALPREIETENGRTRLVVELPRTDDVRSFVEMLRTVYPGTELAARRDHDRPVRTRETFADSLRAQLTDRQREVLRTAYFSGYFATPRESTGEEVAESLDITQPTFANHLRAAERKLFELLYES
ncbi:MULTISPECIES: bacterio-opsin activator domain-containing protein [Halorussus]|uniref:bacterio-opsin activator domain-containing protein n=1 Tax=Halorussus TaxID=1070314 RepID=UPI0020A1DCCF|nr:bacterio-opsin activator domain-containing protein [Halorussus vallis]USZ77079.1 GAF domain-containing protein [Halorussus vallis]